MTFSMGLHPGELSASSPLLDIAITDEGYAPEVTVIPVNTLVTWTNIEGFHTTTSRDGLWDSGVLGVGDSFSHMFGSVDRKSVV